MRTDKRTDIQTEVRTHRQTYGQIDIQTYEQGHFREIGNRKSKTC